MSKLVPQISSRDHIQGDPAHAEIVLVEYGDYQCPSCGEAYPIVKALQRAFGEKLLFVFRNFPLQEIHPDAFKAALSAEAADAQGKFWEMHDVLYENQQRLDWEAITAYAQSIGLDLNRFESVLQEDSLQNRIEEDIESGLRSGVNGTPSFYVNGIKYEGDWGYEELSDYITELIR